MNLQNRIVRRLREFAGRLAVESRGNVAMLFGLSLPVLVLMTVGGVEIHRASTVRMNLQDALDAAALAAARSEHTDNEGIARVGMAVLRANMHAFPNTALLEDQVSFRLNDQGAVVASAGARVDTLIGSMIFGDDIDVGVSAEVMRSNYRIELALVIDNTGSMAGSKLRNTQAAAVNLVERLAAAAARSVEEDAVRIALVPFSQTVRVGSEYRNANWMDRSANASGNDYIFSGGGERLAMFNRLNVAWAGCVESRPYPYDTLDTAPAASNRDTLFVHYFAPDEPDVNDYDHDRVWEDYRTDNNYLDDGLSATSSNKDWWKRLRRTQKYSNSPNLSNDKGPNRGCTLEPVTRLTTEYGTITDSIGDMVAVGNTNIPMGLMWGWHALSPNAPFEDGRPYGEDRLQKIAILMTDGDNVNDYVRNPLGSRYSGLGYIGQGRLGLGESSSGRQRRDAMDNRLAELCANMQSSGIILYTVGVGVDERTQSLLRACATTPGNFYNVSGSSGIADAFDRIAGSIENLRISR